MLAARSRRQGGAPDGRTTLTPARTARYWSATKRAGLKSGHGRPSSMDGPVQLVLPCPRAPRLISVHEPTLLGDMMIDGVPRGRGVRPLSLSGPASRGWRQYLFGSGPHGISGSVG